MSQIFTHTFCKNCLWLSAIQNIADFTWFWRMLSFWYSHERGTLVNEWNRSSAHFRGILSSVRGDISMGTSERFYDHCPLVLKVGEWDWGPKPFRFNNFLLENMKFKGVVEEAWRSQNVSGWISLCWKKSSKVLNLRSKSGIRRSMEERVWVIVSFVCGKTNFLNYGDYLSKRLVDCAKVFIIGLNYSDSSLSNMNKC